MFFLLVNKGLAAVQNCPSQLHSGSVRIFPSPHQHLPIQVDHTLQVMPPIVPPTSTSACVLLNYLPIHLNPWHVPEMFALSSQVTALRSPVCSAFSFFFPHTLPQSFSFWHRFISVFPIFDLQMKNTRVTRCTQIT